MIIKGLVMGDKALTEQFKALSELAKSKVIRQATSYAMTPVLQEGRRRTPVSDPESKGHRSKYSAAGELGGEGAILTSGFLRRSLIKKSSQSKNRYATRTKVGAAGKHAYYGLFLERGFRSYAPNPFLQESLGATANEAVARYKQKLKQAIEREAKKRKKNLRLTIARDMIKA